MCRKLIVSLWLLSVLAVSPRAHSQEISYSGSSTIGMSVLQEGGAVKAFEEKTGIKFKSVEMPGSGKGVQALIAGTITLAGASRALETGERKQKILGHTIGYDAIAVFVHKANPIKNLSKDQVKGIFTGRIRNWKEVGGKNVPIQPNTEISGEERATMLAFQEMAMDKAAYGRGFKEIDFPRDQIAELAKNENGICTVSLGLLSSESAEVREKVKVLSINGVEPNEKNIRSGGYIISRPLVLATKGLPQGNVKKFIDYMLSPDGQKIVSRNFVPVRK